MPASVRQQTLRLLAAVVFTYSFSTALVVYNKWLFSTCDRGAADAAPNAARRCRGWGFPYPLVVTCFHMLLLSLATELYMRWRPHERPHVPASYYRRYVIALGVFVALDIVLTNAGYLFLEASFVEMIKSSMPASVLVLALCNGLEEPSALLLGIVALISVGLAVASAGEVNFSALGLLLELAAVLCGSGRLVFQQLLLHRARAEGDARVEGERREAQGDGEQGLAAADDISGSGAAAGAALPSPLSPPSRSALHPYGLRPMQLLYFQAPVSFIALLPAAVFSAMLRMPESRFLGDAAFALQTLLVLMAGGALALGLNLGDILLVDRSSALTSTVIGTVKTVVVIGVSWLTFRNEISLLNLSGYGMCMVGVVMYNVFKLRKLRRASAYEEAVEPAQEMEDMPLDGECDGVRSNSLLAVGAERAGGSVEKQVKEAEEAEEAAEEEEEKFTRVPMLSAPADRRHDRVDK